MKNKVVLITGGSSGIGKETAIAFAKNNAKVLITGRKLDKLQEVVNQHVNINYLVVDSLEESSAKTIIEKVINDFGRLDVLVNNVGGGLTATIEEITAKEVSDLFAVNIVSMSLLTKLSIPYLKLSKGTVINISSTLGDKVVFGLSHYGASKAAVNYLTKAWALELAPEIRVNAIAPGPTESGALTGMMGLTKEQALEAKEQERKIIPLQRRGVPSDISQWILELANEKSSWITGQVIGVDGGFGLV